jgi:hypothetical protein
MNSIEFYLNKRFWGWWQKKETTTLNQPKSIAKQIISNSASKSILKSELCWFVQRSTG